VAAATLNSVTRTSVARSPSARELNHRSLSVSSSSSADTVVAGEPLHDGNCVVVQRAGIEQEGPRVAHRPPALRVARRCSSTIRAKNLGGQCACATGVARVELFHPPPHALALLEHRHLVACDALVREVRDVLGVMQEGHLVVVRPEQQDPAAKLHEPLERRAGAERVVPRLVGEEMRRVRAPATNRRDVVVHDRARVGAQHLDEAPLSRADRAVRASKGGIFSRSSASTSGVSVLRAHSS
jgi:hypothetical protein